MPRKNKIIDLALLEKIAARTKNDSEIVAVLANEYGISRATYYRQKEESRKKGELAKAQGTEIDTFDTVIEKGRDYLKTRLVQTAVDIALGGDKVLLIFLLKAICGYSEVQKIESKQEINVSAESIKEQVRKMSTEQLMQIARLKPDA